MTIAIRAVGSGRPRFKGLIYGPWGLGKTLLAMSAQQHSQMKPVMVVNIEDGTATGNQIPGIVETEPLDKVADADEVFWNLANDSKGYEQIQTVVIDSGSALSNMAISESARANAKANKSEIRVSQQDYLDATIIMTDLLRRYRNLDRHIIVTAALREDYDIVNPVDKLKRGPAQAGPAFNPALAKNINHIFDHIWALVLDDDDGERTLLTQRSPDHPYTAKTRGKEFAEALGPVVKNPSLPDIFDLYLKTQTVGDS
jgi:hypothetical protein